MHKCVDCQSDCDCKDFLMDDFNQHEEDYDCIGCESTHGQEAKYDGGKCD